MTKALPWIVGGVGTIAVAAAGMWWLSQRAPAPQATVAIEQIPAPQPEPVMAPMSGPVLDVLRVDPTGEGLVAGHVSQRGRVAVHLAGQLLTQGAPEGDGRFVVFVTIPPSEVPRRLVLSQNDGALVGDSAIIAPFGVAPVLPSSDGALAAAGPSVAFGVAETPAHTVLDADAQAAPTAPQAMQQQPAPTRVTGAEAPVVAPAEPSARAGKPPAPSAPVVLAADPGPAAPGAPVAQPGRPAAKVPQTAPLTGGATHTVARAAPSVEAATPVAAPAAAPQQSAAASAETLRRPSDGVQADPETASRASDLASPPPAERPSAPATPTAPVQGPGAPVLVAGADGVRVMPAADAAPELLQNVSLDLISYTQAGDVALAGAGAHQSLRVYLDNRPVTETPARQGGTWQVTLPEVDEGVYTLRVDSLDAKGTVISRVETPFRKESPAHVAQLMAAQTAQDGFDVAVRTVQPGNTLWAIAEETYGEGILYVRVFRANAELIRDPDLIYPGQVFRLPQEGNADAG